MLTEKVFLVEILGERLRPGIGRDCIQCQPGDLLKHNSMVSRLGGRNSPAERRMTGNENSGCMQRIALSDSPNNGEARVELVILANFGRF
jgi:hypothetical protein